MITLAILGLSVVSALLYRFGGAGKVGDGWDWLRNTKARDAGCSAVTTLAIYLVEPTIPWWWLVIHFGLLWGALTTYWDFLNSEKEVWWTWIITGCFYGVAALPCSPWAGWLAVLLRIGVLGLTTMTWRQMYRPKYLNDAVWDEAGVGFLLTVSVLILGWL